MQIEEYSEKAYSTAMYPNKGNNPIYPSLGLGGEIGESCEKLKKEIRDSKTFSDIEFAKELGDILWYTNAWDRECCEGAMFSMLATQYGHFNIVLQDAGTSKETKYDDMLELWEQAVIMRTSKTFHHFLLFMHIWAQLCRHANIEPNTVAQMNIDKLFSRKERGVIQGSGDNR